MGVAYSNVIASARSSNRLLSLRGEAEQAMTVPLGPLGMSIVRKQDCLVKG